MSSTDDARRELSELLALNEVGLKITGARIVGRGSKASADIYLSDGSAVFFEKFSDFANPTRLAVELATTTGATPKLKVPMALYATRLLRQIAKHEHVVTTDALSIEWGTTFLDHAPTIDADVTDQASRWSAFSSLARLDPIIASASQGVSVASASTVIRHTDGARFVRTGWFRGHVRREGPALSPAEIAARMTRVGWQRPGREGRMKATCPSRPDTLVWAFFVVPANWDEVTR